MLRGAEFDGLEAALRHYLATQAMPCPPEVAIGIATPVSGDQVRMTNLPWGFSIGALQQALGAVRLKVINDFTALALAVPALPSHELIHLGGGEPAGPATTRAAKAVIGPGTGLGVSGLIWSRGHWVALETEGGHVSASPRTAREWDLVNWVQGRHGHASAERLLSGPGLALIREGLRALDGQAPAPLAPEAVAPAAQAGDPWAQEAIELFLGLLGTTAGNLALTLGARGGVYLGGGILPRLKHQLAASALRARFEDKGRFRSYLQAVPLWLIARAGSPALLGAAAALDLPD